MNRKTMIISLAIICLILILHFIYNMKKISKPNDAKVLKVERQANFRKSIAERKANRTEYKKQKHTEKIEQGAEPMDHNYSEEEKLALEQLKKYGVILPEGDPIPGFDSKKYVSEVMQLFDNNATSDEKIDALENLSTFMDPMIMPVIMKAMSDPDPDVRMIAVESSGFMNRAEAVPAILIGLDDASDDVREAAANAMLMIQDAAIHPALDKALSDPLEDIREAALDTLIMQDHPHVVDYIENNFEKYDEYIQSEMIDALDLNSDKRKFLIIAEKGLNSPFYEVRENALDTLQSKFEKDFTTISEWKNWLENNSNTQK